MLFLRLFNHFQHQIWFDSLRKFVYFFSFETLFWGFILSDGGSDLLRMIHS